MKCKRKRNRKRMVLHLCCGLVYFAGACLTILCKWINDTYHITFNELLFTLVSPLKGTSIETVIKCVKECLPLWILAVLFYLFAILLVRWVEKYIKIVWTCRIFGGKERRMELTRYSLKIGGILSAVCVIFAGFYVSTSLKIPEALKSRLESTQIYEQYYVDPAGATITPSGNPKNLIYIYLESMETAYSSKEEGGFQNVNYIPNLTALAKENVSFSHSETLGGFRPITGTTWTMGALFASTSGVPFSFPVEGNAMDQREAFASGVTALGDILESFGYTNEFLCGSDADFAGRKAYFQQHGNYEIFDLYTAREYGYIPQDYFVWWGYEDKILYQIAQDELLRLAQQPEPFNLTLLTVDTHFTDGYICDICGDEYETVAENVVKCADSQIAEFIEWCKQQEFYKDTVIVISGDHPRMDKDLVEGIEYQDRTVYNCFINCERDTVFDQNRDFTEMDMLPTVLFAMGYDIEGERLGLGTNLFSAQKTLAEQMGYQTLKEELSKYSSYYVENFS